MAVSPGVTEAVVGEIVIEETAGAPTVIVAFSVTELLVEEVAVMVAVPSATPVTTPVEASTVAILASEVPQLTVSLVSSTPFWSRTVALKFTVAPGVVFAVEGVTVIEETVAATTVIAAVAETEFSESEVAVIVAVPVVVPPVTTPSTSTVATLSSEDVQVTVSPLITTPFWSVIVGVSVWVAEGVSVAEVGDSVIEVTVPAITVTVAVPVTVLSVAEVAVIVASPKVVPPVTTPVEASTVATLSSEDDQVTVSLLISSPFWL